MKMRDGDDEDMAAFIAQQRLRLAHERETLQRNPPSAVTDYIMDEEEARKHHVEVEKRPLRDQEFIANAEAGKVLKAKPPTPQLFKLGEAYKQQKEKLKEELREDYRKALAEKQGRTTGIRGRMITDYQDGHTVKKSDEIDLGLSLPIRDHLSAKERLRLERNREYNEFKTDKENEEKLKSPRRLTTYATPVSYPTLHVNEATQVTPPIADKKPVITETYQELLDRKRKEEKAYRNTDRLEDEVVYKDRRVVDDDDRRLSRRIALPSKRKARVIERYYDDDDDDDDDETEEELIERLRARRQRKQRSRRYIDSDEEEDEDALFRRVRRGEPRRKEDRRRLNSAENRSKKTLPESDKQNDLRSKSAPPDEYTGLPIGKITSANTVQRRKDEYKLELQKQMEENSNKKKRGRELELQIDAANDLISKKQQKVATKEEDMPDKDKETKRRSKKKGKKTSFKIQDSSDSDSEEDRRRPYGRQFHRPNPYAPPANGYFPPPAMPFQSPYDEAYYYYGARNPLDPPGMGGVPLNQPPVPYQPGVSPLLAAAESKLSVKGPQTTTFSEATKDSQRTIVARGTFHSNAESSLVSDESRDAQKKKEMMQAYQDELKEQMSIKDRKKREAKWEQEQYDKKMELEAMNYNPWGKGGGGAPMRDLHGNLISDLRQMHIQNEDLVRDPSKVAEMAKQRQQMIENTEEIFHQSNKQETMLSEHLSPRFGRSNPFEQKETFEQKSQKDVYKDELQQQIVERRRLEAERKEQLRIAEEKEEKRMQEENRKMQEEYDNEQKKQRDKIVEQQRKNEELQRALEEKRLKEERRRKEEQRRREETEREQELEEKLRQTSTSPNIKAEKRNTARSSVSQKETVPKQVVTEHVVSRSPAPVHQPQPVTYERQHTPNIVIRPEKSRESKRISRELSALRKQLLSEQQRIETQLRNSETSVYQQPTYQPTAIRQPEAVVDLSRTRQRPVQVVHRPPTVDRPNSKALKEFTDFKHRQDDTASLRMFRIQHPDTPVDTAALEKQQEDMIKNQLMKIETLKNKTLDQPHHSRRSPTKSAQNGFSLLPPSESYASLLETETTFVPVVEENDSENRPPSHRSRKSSARERRRVKRSEEEGGLTYRAAPDNYSVNSLNSLATLDIDRMANKNKDRLNKLKAIQGDEISLTDPDDILDRFVNQQKTTNDLPATPETFAPNPRRPRKGTSISAPQHERSPSVNTLDTELWLRPGTGPPATAT